MNFLHKDITLGIVFIRWIITVCLPNIKVYFSQLYFDQLGYKLGQYTVKLVKMKDAIKLLKEIASLKLCLVQIFLL